MTLVLLDFSILQKFWQVRQSKPLSEGYGDILLFVSHLFQYWNDGASRALARCFYQSELWNVVDDRIATLLLISRQLLVGKIASEHSHMLFHLVVVYLGARHYNLWVWQYHLYLLALLPNVVSRERT